VAEIFTGRTISISGKAGEGKTKLALCTHHIAQAVRDVDLILIVVPSLYHRVYAEALAPVLKSGQHVVLIPGTLGSLEFMTIIRQKGCTAEIPHAHSKQNRRFPPARVLAPAQRMRSGG
jgi:opine dehydrogenase